MKIVNIDVDGEIKLVNIFDTDNKTSQTINRAFRVPAGNYKNIILKFNFISPSAKQENLHLFAIFKTDYIEKAIEVEIVNLEAEGEIYNNSCFIPSEVLQQKGIVKLGIYGYILDENETLKKRLSLAPISHSVINGSYEEDVESPIIPTPTVFEVYFDKVKKTNDKMEENLSNYENKISTRFDEVEELLNDKLLFYKKYESVVYANSGTTEVAINIQEYSETCLLFVDINGLDLIKDVDYTVDNSLKKIILKNKITVDNTAIHFVCLKTTVATSKDYDALKGDKGEIGETGPRGPQGPKGDPADKAVVYKSATGNSVKLDECSGTYKLKKVNVLGEMNQETRLGYNKLVYPYIDTTKTTKGITFSDLGDGRVMANGDATEDAYFNLSRPTVKTGTYLYTTGVSGSTSSYFCKFGTTNIINKSNLNFSEEFTPTESYICIKKGTKVSNLIFEPMLVEGSTEKEFEQFGTTPSFDFKSEVEGVESYNKFKNSISIDSSNGITIIRNNASSITYSGTTTESFYNEIMNFDNAVLTEKMYLKRFGDLTGVDVILSYYNPGETVTRYSQLKTDIILEIGTTLKKIYIQQNSTGIKVEGTLEVLYTAYKNKDKEFIPYGVIQTKNQNKNYFDLGTNTDEWSSFSDNGSKLMKLVGIPDTVKMTIGKDKLTIDNYDTSNFYWIGKRIFLKKDYDYIVNYNHSLPWEIYGFDSLTANTVGTKINVSEKSFNSGRYNYYFIVFYPKETGEYLENYQIIENGEDSSYIKHQEKIFQLSLGDRILYGDSNARDYFKITINEDLYRKTGNKKITELKLIRNWEKYTFTGEEVFRIDAINNFFITEIIKNKVYDDLTIKLVYNNYLLGIANNDWRKTRRERDYFTFVATAGYLYFNCLTYNDVDTLKTKLQELNDAGNPMYVIYRLKTPTEEVITDTTLISQFEDLINGYTYEDLTYAEIQALGILEIEYWTWYKGEKGEIELDDTKLDNLITEKMKMMYPVGSIILKMNNVNPSTYLGFGTWELIAQGRTLVGVNTSDSDFNTVNKTGGAKTHKHWAGGYKANMNLNAIDNKIYIDAQFGKSNPEVSYPETARFNFPNGTEEAHSGENSVYGVSVSGQSAESSNVMPYLTTYIWHRKA